jgi:integrase/recombinase XerD
MNVLAITRAGRTRREGPAARLRAVARTPCGPGRRTGAGCEFLGHLEAGGELERFFASDGEHDRRSAVADWRRRLVDRRFAPATVNLALAAVTSLLDSRALRPPDVPRVEVDPKVPRALSQPQVRALQRETDRLPSSRDRAIVQLLMLTGVRIGELAALEVEDVRPTGRTGELVIRHGKGDRRRLVPLSRPARAALREWLADRIAHRSQPSVKSGPLWISRTGEQMSVRSLGKIVSAVMDRAGIEDSAHALRHTVATRLVRDHRHDLVLVADILGHADVKTTRHYARSGLEDRRAALEDLAD